uniref:DNA-directed RNA polymerase subunit Rpo1N n=1 Tax=uncultured marine group II/III euryarchaeote KM3_139_C07 TaxID=1457870 RepID=A0A075GGN6_9EURY|nr:DNA-directed RNA polymerase subunit A' (rpoA1) [uncultured marine group II/III euryarchaeote KM3_139_C07]
MTAKKEEKVEEKPTKVEKKVEETPKEAQEDKKSLQDSASQNKVEEKRKQEEDIFESYIYKKIKSIKFGILSPKLIQKMAAAKIVTPELYDNEGYPVDGGLMDIRMGVIDPGLRCKTCGSKLKECLGHFGYIELARSVIHINFVSEILDLMRGTCRSCNRILIPDDIIKKHNEELEGIEKEFGILARRQRIKDIIKKIKTINKCPHCKGRQHKIMLEKPTTFIENEKRLTPIDLRTRLEKIPDEDIEVFGFDPASIRPEWMVLTILPIPPVTIRPSITLESGERSEDDLTHKLGDIVRINQRLFENINAGAPEIIIEDLWDLLQYHVTTFFDNAVAQLPPARHRSGQPLKTLAGRIKSKEGRIRHNLAGRRTNFSARSAISPDPSIELNDVGVPKEIAMNLTVPEKITEWNLDYLKGFVERGPTVYPGANYVITPSGKKKRITDETKEEILEELDKKYSVERHLIDGDVAIFNRQPSLHRMSMMCHRVRVLPYKTFRMNPCVCAPYNADFDGDEMNLHIPQTEEARAEAKILMQVQTQLISPRYGLSIMGAIQGAITGSYILTSKLVFTREEAINILHSVGVYDCSRLPNKKEISGKEVFSLVLPQDFDFKAKSKGGEEVIIKNGELKTGIIDNNIIGGGGSGLMLRALHKKYGPDETIILISKMFRLGLESLLKHGFTTAISDTDLQKEVQQKIEDSISKAEDEVKVLIEQYKNKTLEVFPGKTGKETLELKILERLNKARNLVGQLVIDSLGKDIPTMIMANSGSRGNVINIAQMTANVGQQAMRGKRIEKGFKDRTMSCFKRGDLSPEAHGFIRSSFKTGLKPHEFFFAAMTGRDSLMDTALRTPKSGYLYRRLSNAMQDLKVEYDETVRDATGNIVQFKYGEDGMDVSKSEEGILNVKKIIESFM